MWLTGSPVGPRVRLLAPFAALALLLVAIVSGLVYSAQQRLEEQRALRHRMVAERIFDELEREIGSVLQHEAERPSQAYDAAQTDPARWSPFVVGYFRRDPVLRLVAEAKLPAQRAERLRTLVDAAQPALLHAAQSGVRPSAPTRPNLDEPRAASTSSPELLRLLNRSGQLRERRLHDFVRSFAIVHQGRALIAERQTADGAGSEGLVLDVPLLLDTLTARLLGEPALHGLRMTLDTPLTAAGPPAGYLYRHPLAPPLAPHTVSLALPLLDDVDTRSALYGFAALFAVATVLGLWAIHRMLVVQIAFAERRNNFVSAVTHELRTPLTTIRMYAEMLRDGMVREPATQQEYYATITAEGERLTRLINNVMEHGRLRRGQRRPQLQRVSVDALVRETVEMMRPHLEREGFELVLHGGVADQVVQLDPDALKQILFNVLDNARKYGRGQQQARIEVDWQLAAAGMLQLRVRDHGPGVPDAQLGVLFEPFYRGEAELTREHQGTGLGLALVRDLAKLMHGTVSAHNCAPGLELRVCLRCS